MYTIFIHSGRSIVNCVNYTFGPFFTLFFFYRTEIVVGIYNEEKVFYEDKNISMRVKNKVVAAHARKT
jgi:hypothetical protein